MLNRPQVGLYIGTDSIRVVQLQVKGSQIKVIKAGYRPLPFQDYNGGVITQPRILAEALGEIWGKVGLNSSRASISLGGPQVLSRTLTLPSMPAKEMRSAIHWELESHFPLPASEAVFDFNIIGTFSNGQGKQEDLLVVAAPRKVVDSYLETLELAGIEAQVLEPESLALIRALGRGKEESLFLAVADKYTNVVIVQGQKVVFHRVVPWEQEDLKALEPLGQEGIGTMERGNEFVRECRRSLEYCHASTDGRIPLPREVFLFPPGLASNQYLVELLEGELGLPVRGISLPGERELVWSVDISPEERDLYAVSVGLALGEVRGYG